jgi:putative ABC transport system permease protein
MTFLRKLIGGLRALFRKQQSEREMDEELKGYLDAAMREKMRSGMSREQARRATRVEMGSVEAVKENIRGAGWESILETLWQDIRYGLRQLRRSPGFTAVAVITLALGIGANTAIFSVVDAVLLRPLPFHNPDKLVQLFEKEAAPGHYPFTGPDYLDIQAQTQTLEGTSLFGWGGGFNASGAGEPERAYVVSTQANFFSLLGVKPTLGRTFLSGEDQAGRNHVAILSYGFWQQHLGGNRDAIGGPLELNGEKYTVVGVMPAWFRSLAEADVWVPMDMSPKALGPRGQHQYQAIGRLKPDVQLANAQAELDAIVQRIGKQFPDSSETKGAIVSPLKEQLVGDSRPQLLIMLGAVGLVLLIACANVASLSLVRATGRHREIAIRKAMGADRGRVVRQLLTESVMLSLAGAAVGLLLGWICLRVLATLESIPIPRANPIGLNGTVLAFTLGTGVLVGIFIGLAPALQVSQLQLNEELKASAQVVLGPSSPRRILRDALVTGEIAISLMLLISAGLLLRSFQKLRGVKIGARSQGVMTAQIVLPPGKYNSLDKAEVYFGRLLDGLKSTPGVEAVALGSHLPLEGGSNGYITVEGRESSAYENVLVEQNAVSPEYFRTLGIPFIKGRNLTERDAESTTESLRKLIAMMQSGNLHPSPDIKLVAVINQTMAHQFWPNQDPIGEVFKMGGAFPVRVIGVVGDVKEWGIRQPVIPQAYYPLPYALAPPMDALTIVIRGSTGTNGLLATVRSQVHSLDSSLALFRVRTMDEVISRSMSDTRYQSTLLLSFAVLALLLTAVGIYGVMAYAVTQRTHEIGIRLALGAHPGEILRLILRHGAQTTLAGIVVGIAGALALTRFLATLLFGVEPEDPFTFIVVAVFLAVIGLLASYIPARRATKVDPMVALRYE